MHIFGLAAWKLTKKSILLVNSTYSLCGFQLFCFIVKNQVTLLALLAYSCGWLNSELVYKITGFIFRLSILIMRWRIYIKATSNFFYQPTKHMFMNVLVVWNELKRSRNFLQKLVAKAWCPNQSSGVFCSWIWWYLHLFLWRFMDHTSSSVSMLWYI